MKQTTKHALYNSQPFDLKKITDGMVIILFLDKKINNTTTENKYNEKNIELKKFENSLLESHKVNQNVARNLLNTKPLYNLNNAVDIRDNKSNAVAFDHKQLIKQAQTGNLKDKLFSRVNENESKRDIASEIDYSDHKSITAMIKIQK